MSQFWKRYIAWENSGIEEAPQWVLWSALLCAAAMILLIAKFYAPLLSLDWVWYLGFALFSLLLLFHFLVRNHAMDWYLLNLSKLLLMTLVLILAKLWIPLMQLEWYWFALFFLLTAAYPFIGAVKDMKKF